jgi:hypothetical protein
MMEASSSERMLLSARMYIPSSLTPRQHDKRLDLDVEAMLTLILI